MPKEKGQTIQCQKRKDRQYNAKRERTDNTMPKEKGQTIQCQKRKDKNTTMIYKTLYRN
jgi:hypothetical protein